MTTWGASGVDSAPMGQRALKIEIVSGKADEEPTVVEHTGVQTSRELRRQLRKRRGEGLWAYVRINGERIDDRDLTQYVESGHSGGSGASKLEGEVSLRMRCQQEDIDRWDAASRDAGAPDRASWIRATLDREAARVASRKK